MWRRFACLAVLLGLTCAPAAFAWGPGGHETVGALADQLIAGTNAAKQVRKILRSNLKTASVWADCAKGVTHNNGTGKFAYTSIGKYPECAIYEKTDASRALMVSFATRNWNNCVSAPGREPCHKRYHYTDVAVGHDAYAEGLTGTEQYDIVGAIRAAIAVLQDDSVPAPFNFTSKKEALRLLAHYVGDLHQPLHVTAIYLDSAGDVIDPDSGTFDPASATRGGNEIVVRRIGTRVISLHTDWDSIPAGMTVEKALAANTLPATLKKARAVAPTLGLPAEWSTRWATETIQSGKGAFDGLTFSAQDAASKQWALKTPPPGYNKTRSSLQSEQLIKAGARLAQLLTTLWP